MKNSFVLYMSYKKHFESLSMEQRGFLISAIFAHEAGEDLPDLDPVTRMAFEFIKDDLDINREKYEARCKRNAINGANGGRPKKATAKQESQEQTVCFEETEKTQSVISETKKNPLKPNETQAKTQKPKKPDNEYEYDNDNDIKNTLSGKPTKSYPYDEVISYLNEKSGKSFRSASKEAQRCIRARFDEKYTLDDFKKVVDNMVSRWKGTSQEEYLRPITLFGTKFESYLQAGPKHAYPDRRNQFNNSQNSQRYDFAAIEAAALSANRGS